MKPIRTLLMSATAAALAIAPSAHAAPNLGVTYVHFDPFTTQCSEGQALPCGPLQGQGTANTIDVHQKKINGQWVYDSIDVPGLPDGELWISAKFGGKCRRTYRPVTARADTGRIEYQGMNYPEEVDGWGGQSLDFDSSQRLIQDHEIDMRIPHEGVFRSGAQDDALVGFPTYESILDFGEFLVEKEMQEEGVSEHTARSRLYEMRTYLEMHAWLRCRSTVWGAFAYDKVVPEALPITIKFRPKPVVAGETEGRPTFPGDGPGVLVAGTAVTQAFLSIKKDPENDCRLRLSGVLVSTAPTEVSYRFVDELGHLSADVFAAEIDHTLSVLVDHYVDLPFVGLEGSGSGGNLVSPQPQGGSTGDKAAQSTDREQGTYQIKGILPHAFESNIAGFNVEPCGAGQTAPLRRSEGRTTSTPPGAWRR